MSGSRREGLLELGPQGLGSGRVLDRDMVGALNIGLRALAPGGGCGFPLDRAPWGVGKVCEPTPRASPGHRIKNI